MKSDNQRWKALTPLEHLMAANAVPENPVIISACLALAKNVTSDWLSNVFVSRIIQHPRFSSRIVEKNGHFSFQPVPDFTSSSPSIMKDHITFESEIDSSLSHQQRHQIFIQRLQTIISSDLPNDRPLWKLHIFPNWSVLEEDHNGPESCCTIIARIHHSIADGIGLVKYFLAQVIDKPSDDESSGIMKPPGTHRFKLGMRRKRFRSNAKKISDEVKTPVKRQRKTGTESTGFLQLLRETIGDIYNGSVGMLFPDKRCIFTRSPIQKERVCAMLSPKEFSVATIKGAAKRLGVSINDLLYSAMAGASRRYLNDFGEDIQSLSGIRCAVPFNSHMFDEYKLTDVSNQVALIALPMHVSTEDPYQRLQECSATLTRAKRGVQITTSMSLLNVLVKLPSFVKHRLWNHLTKCTSFLFTNVPGPTERVQLDGIDVTSIQFLAPADGDAGIILCAFSYDGMIMLSLSGDSNRISKPQRFLDMMAAEIHILINLSKDFAMSPNQS